MEEVVKRGSVLMTWWSRLEKALHSKVYFRWSWDLKHKSKSAHEFLKYFSLSKSSRHRITNCLFALAWGISKGWKTSIAKPETVPGKLEWIGYSKRSLILLTLNFSDYKRKQWAKNSHGQLIEDKSMSVRNTNPEYGHVYIF